MWEWNWAHQSQSWLHTDHRLILVLSTGLSAERLSLPVLGHFWSRCPQQSPSFVALVGTKALCSSPATSKRGKFDFLVGFVVVVCLLLRVFFGLFVCVFFGVFFACFVLSFAFLFVWFLV